jgi:hypothetical protein
VPHSNELQKVEAVSGSQRLVSGGQESRFLSATIDLLEDRKDVCLETLDAS